FARLSDVRGPRWVWQAARPLGEYGFLGRTVAPGFEFKDFEMLSEGSAALAHIASLRATLPNSPRSKMNDVTAHLVRAAA
ncbi:MAG: hypothetical protein DME58_11155, partial [Verrucomicrobia bacterium]